ncbi:sigma-54 dependent transcriptional regulator [Spirochaetia bacterium 38H-sp]|uniref:Sigma-54 dependent transcriptional regulator n=1 Tax=Rarispira pelagica TaxID=3141764 RepID=A0ABU9U9C8_9SPIR
MKANILIIDDEENIRLTMEAILEDEGYTVISAEDGLEGLKILEKYDIDIVFLDLWLPHKGGMEILPEIKERFPHTEVIVISGHGNIDTAVKAVKTGAYDFLEKPLSMERITTVTRNVLQLNSLKRENSRLKNKLVQEDLMIGSSPAIQQVKEKIIQSASSDARIMILGENGTGKELVAKEIHKMSNRADMPFVEVNCAAIPDTLLESELFGHEKGAFTGAHNSRKGKFEMAHRGTLFLDEIGDMSLASQAKVLRAIQDLQFSRVGGEHLINVDVRIISATNKNLEEEVKKGNFREDLFFRLNVIPITVPPLRERIDDIPLLTKYFIEKFTTDSNQAKSITEEAIKTLQDYHWPGNVRELKNTIERICVLVDKNEIEKEDILEFIGKSQPSTENKTSEYLDRLLELSLNEAKDKFEKTMIEIKLKENHYNISKTAASLGIYSSNLHAKIKKYNIEIKK